MLLIIVRLKGAPWILEMTRKQKNNRNGRRIDAASEDNMPDEKWREEKGGEALQGRTKKEIKQERGRTLIKITLDVDMGMDGIDIDFNNDMSLSIYIHDPGSRAHGRAAPSTPERGWLGHNPRPVVWFWVLGVRAALLWCGLWLSSGSLPGLFRALRALWSVKGVLRRMKLSPLQMAVGLGPWIT